MGKLIYQPEGKAHEYCHWACNLYNGCSNRCSYCYNRKGRNQKLLGKDSPTLKAGFENEDEAFATFKKELLKYRESILEDGGELFFNFVSDPCLPETIELNFRCILFAMQNGVACRVLTKREEISWVLLDYVEERNYVDGRYYLCLARNKRQYFSIGSETPRLEDIPNFFSLLKVGFTLTFSDDIEPGASRTIKRVSALRRLDRLGIHTWASIEPIVNTVCSEVAMESAYKAGCREFKIGLLSGKKEYSSKDVIEFYHRTNEMYKDCNIYWKDSVMKVVDE